MVIDPVLVLKGRGERNIARTVIIMATAQVLNLNQLELLYMLGGEIQSDTGVVHLQLGKDCAHNLLEAVLRLGVMAVGWLY